MRINYGKTSGSNGQAGNVTGETKTTVTSIDDGENLSEAEIAARRKQNSK